MAKEPLTIKLLDTQVARFDILVAATDKAHMTLAACRGRLDLYIDAIRDAHGVSGDLGAVKLNDGEITFSEEHESNVRLG